MLTLRNGESTHVSKQDPLLLINKNKAAEKEDCLRTIKHISP